MQGAGETVVSKADMVPALRSRDVALLRGSTVCCEGVSGRAQLRSEEGQTGKASEKGN